MVFKNAEVFLDGDFIKSDFSVENGFFSEISTNISCKSTELDWENLENYYVIPGLVDIHTHGCLGYDFGDANLEEMAKMEAYYLQSGTTSLLPTLVALPLENYSVQMSNILEIMTKSKVFAGINSEGPFLAKSKKGAINEENLSSISIDFAQKLWEISQGKLKLMTVAPELSNFPQLVDFAKNKFKLSLGHTDCDSETAKSAFSLGNFNVTHLFNAMNSLHHREPALVGVALENNCIKEAICDGVHLADSLISMLFKGFAEEIALISDSTSGTGLNDGIYHLGGLEIIVKGGTARLKNGVLAGSCNTLFDDLKYVISLGIDKNKAILSATEIPAKSVGLDCGQIKQGAMGDFLVLDKAFNLKSVYKLGSKIK